MRIFVILMLLGFFSIPVWAESPQEGKGYIYVGTPGAEQLTVSQLQYLPDETYVSLNGNIVAKGDNFLYTFRDSSGEIPVRINDNLFTCLSISPQDSVRITGGIDMKDGKKLLIDVKELEILNK